MTDDDGHEEGDQPMQRALPVGSRGGHRFFAAYMDNVLAILTAYASVQLLPIHQPMILGLSMYVFYLAYYAVLEAFFAQTFGKWYFGLKVVGKDGAPCSGSQAIVRTAFRLLDANPLFMGGFPAGILIWTTKRRQHLGDLFAGTFVVDC